MGVPVSDGGIWKNWIVKDLTLIDLRQSPTKNCTVE